MSRKDKKNVLSLNGGLGEMWIGRVPKISGTKGRIILSKNKRIER